MGRAQNMISAISEAVGLSEQTLVFVLGLFSIYPIAAIYRLFIWGQSKAVQNVFIALSGFSLIYSCFANDAFNVVFCALVQWIMLKTLVRTTLLIPLSFLCLRMIGLAFDCHDGHKDAKLLRPEQKERALDTIPSLLEILAFSLNFNGVLIGPQFPFTTHNQLVSGKLIESPNPPPTVGLSMRSLMHGVCMLVLHQIMCSDVFFATAYMESPSYFEQPFWYRLAYISLNGIFYFHKHVATWTIIRGGNILTGISYEKKGDVVSFDKFKNVDYANFHLAQSNHDVIKGFNLCTNDWAARYIFKRCIWIGNKNISHVLTLFFLAIWHGTDVCYFTAFAHEFL